ncbi:hypothetical protein GFS60_05111 [Rhodococcus sp. WAY2]|nr:hypothetical protein GFS60_05111 [Rhodococcus sp. WAY2]
MAWFHFKNLHRDEFGDVGCRQQSVLVPYADSLLAISSVPQAL